ncbi:MAG: alkyl hydroperoxide reductase subunit F [Acidobacteria bacterium]|nr:MAG: alkyl hydroperoxide reductase subunit F [Acidobacteriota bacterium]MCE7957810.1 alkyl hydroperoxide reductase subunit F [Acidobacteria bacterium ACB2]
MLDPSLSAQLQQVYRDLPVTVVLRQRPSDHPKQAELTTMLEDLATTNPQRIVCRVEGEACAVPAFEVGVEGKAATVLFKGIPGGHEYTSLVLAVLNTAGQGKRPDEGIQARIRGLKGPIRLRTFVSLSCHNCPEVVQALNQMALIHPDFVHEMVDGGLAEGEVEKLGIQGVPTVISPVHENAQVSVGRAGLAELLDALEERYGSEPSEAAANAPARDPYDVVVVGGGPAGASAAIYSARKGLRTALVAKEMGGQLTQTVGIENLIGTVRTEGKRLAADLLAHVRSYPVEVLDNRRVETIENGETKTVRLAGGETLQTKALVVATGAQWRELNVPGEKTYIGRGVAFCPHCDGPFYKDRNVVVIGGGNSGVEAAIDLAGICAHVTVIEFLAELKADKVLVDNLKKLPNTDVVVNHRTAEILGDGAKVTGIKVVDRATDAERTIPIDGVFIQIGLAPNSGIVRGLVDVNRFGEIVVDEKCRTSTKGIYAAGDVTTVPWKQIVIAMGEGAKAALAAFEDRIHSASA